MLVQGSLPCFRQLKELYRGKCLVILHCSNITCISRLRGGTWITKTMGFCADLRGFQYRLQWTLTVSGSISSGSWIICTFGEKEIFVNIYFIIFIQLHFLKGSTEVSIKLIFRYWYLFSVVYISTSVARNPVVWQDQLCCRGSQPWILIPAPHRILL